MPRIPLTWLAEHVELPADLTAEQLAADLVRVGLEEEAIHAAAVTGPLVVGEVVELTPEPQKNGKTINWCRVDVGPDHNEPGGAPRGIVCGAHNFVVGDRVVVALPGAVLPGPFADRVAQDVRARVRRHDLLGARAGPGRGPRRDHRAGHARARRPRRHRRARAAGPRRGGARDQRDARPRVLLLDARRRPRVQPVDRCAVHRPRSADGGPPPVGGGFAVEIDDEAPIDGVPGADRFVAQVVRGVRATDPSPAWMQRRLQQAGMRPIKLAVDVTNYVMLDLGQPLHAYDLAHLAEPIVVRRATPGERIRTLDDVDRTLDPEDLLITDSPDGRAASRPIGLAAVMGGGDSEVGAGTTDLLIEAAHFDPITVARTARRHKLPSEAAKRFERGVDPALPPVAVARAVALLVEHGGGVADAHLTDVDRRVPGPPFELDLDLPARLVGVPYTADEVRETLVSIGCKVDGRRSRRGARAARRRGGPTSPSASTWSRRSRGCAGYDAIPSIAARRARPGTGLTAGQRARRSVARALAESGLVEVLSYPFVGTAQLDALGLPADDDRRRAVRLVNPLSDEQPFMRTNLLVTLLDTARRNVSPRRERRGASSSSAWSPGRSPTRRAAPRLPGGVRPSDEDLAAIDAAVPPQPRRVAGVLAGLREPAGWWGTGRRADHTDAIAAARLVAEVVGVELVASADADHAPWHPGRCARLTTVDGTLVGHAGELHPNVVAAHGLPARASAFELDLDVLLAAASPEPRAGRAGVDVPRRQGGRRARGRRERARGRRARRRAGRCRREPGRRRRRGGPAVRRVHRVAGGRRAQVARVLAAAAAPTTGR